MIYLIAAIACSTGNSLIIKFAERKTGNRMSLLLVNYVAAVLFGLALIMSDAENAGRALAATDSATWMLGLINGLLYVTTFVLLQKNILVNGATVSASLSHMGLLIPVLLSIIVFREIPAGVQILGAVFATAAIVLLSIPQKNNAEVSASGSNRVLLVPMLLSSGMADMMSKIFEAYCDHAAESIFMQITFTTSMVLCLAGCLRQREKFNRYDLIYGAVLGVFNYMSVKFLIWALYGREAFMIYILYGIGVILVVNAVNVLIMHEKLSHRDYAGMCLIIAAIIFLNL